MAKKPKAMKCEKCSIEFPESEISEEHKDRAFVWDDQLLCKDCLIMMGGDPSMAQDLWSFNKSQKFKPHDV